MCASTSDENKQKDSSNSPITTLVNEKSFSRANHLILPDFASGTQTKHRASSHTTIHHHPSYRASTHSMMMDDSCHLHSLTLLTLLLIAIYFSVVDPSHRHRHCHLLFSSIVHIIPPSVLPPCQSTYITKQIKNGLHIYGVIVRFLHRTSLTTTGDRHSFGSRPHVETGRQY